MRIFSNFDTKLKKRTVKKYQQRFGKNKVLLIVKWRLFLLLKVIFPFFAFLLSAGVVLILFSVFVWKKVMLYGWVPLVSLGFFIILWPLLRRYIEYKMDFAIATPKMLITYKQRWILRRTIRTINTDNLKTVSVEKKWFRYSISNTGDLIFLSEWADVRHGEIVLYYIHKPEKCRYRIAHILWRD